jgi:hypothetical protein
VYSAVYYSITRASVLKIVDAMFGNEGICCGKSH